MPLSGIHVVDLTRILAGPFCTQLLADLGADVIKIEAPGQGDPVRGQGAIRDGLSWYFAQFNRNKRSLTLDLYQDQGKEVLADLLRRADVLVENYRPGVLARMGFSEARLRELNPRLVVASVNGYGSSGPYALRPAFDFIAQAMSGFMSVNGPPDGELLRAGPPISDLVVGLYAAFGVVSALLARERGTTGGGQQVEASLTGGLISMLAYFSAHHFATGELPERTAIRWSIPMACSMPPTATSRSRRARPRSSSACWRSSASRSSWTTPTSPATPPGSPTASASRRSSTPGSRSAPSPNGSSASTGRACPAAAS